MNKEIDLKKVAFLYFTTLDFDTVFKTQVISWANLYIEQGLDYQIVKAYSAKSLLKGVTRKKDKLNIKELYVGSYKSYITYPDKYVIGSFLNFIIFCILALPKILKGKKVVILTRSFGFDKSLYVLKRIFHQKISVVYDSRAAGAEEYKYYNEPLNEQSKKKFAQMLHIENKMVVLADKVFCVSNKLKEYHLRQHPEIPSHKFHINPCNADESIFYYKQDERDEIRQNLELNDRFVVVYSGGLQMKWHVPKLVFKAFSLIKTEFDNAFFLILTHDQEIASEHAKQAGINEQNYKTMSLDNKQVRPYLSASDMGLLIRDNVIMNNVASPTKFAEYVMCGLPVVISDGVGDFSELAVQNQLGVSINFEHEKQFLTTLKSYCKTLSEQKKDEISQWGRQNFSKQFQINNNLMVFKEIAKA